MKKTLLLLSFCLPVIGFAQSWSDQVSSITNDLNDVHFVDDNNGWAVGRQGKVIHTANAGGTWTQQNSGTTKDLNKVYMVSSTAGYAVGDGGTVMKYNGTSWSALNISFSQDMYGVFFLDASIGWVSGDYGCIKMTTDGGSTWTTQMSNSIYSNTFSDLYMLSSNEGWAVGSSGKVLRYNGTSWTAVSNPATSDLTDLHAVSFVNSNDGVMTGESSTVFHWDGSSWTQDGTDLSNNSYHVYDVVMINSNLGYAATTPGFGGNGVILKYDGNIWSKDYEYTGMNSELFYGITATANGRIYAVAATGIIKVKGSGSSTPTGIAQQQAPGSEAKIYPNPFSSDFVINCSLAQGGEVNVVIQSTDGRIVKTISSSNAATGNYSMAIQAAELSKGFYLYTLNNGGQTVSGKIIKN